MPTKLLTRLVITIFAQALIGYFMMPTTVAGIIDAQEPFKTHCVLCHGEDGKGKTDLGKGLGARDFTEKKFQDSITDEKILEQIENGTPEKMFPFKDKLTAEEMKALVPVIRAFGG
ncbi:MAG: c-type cytochrome [Candidatus Scalindua sp.]|nr:c-type cytochrome [Candidatus Scalindua sp.]